MNSNNLLQKYSILRQSGCQEMIKQLWSQSNRRDQQYSMQKWYCDSLWIICQILRNDEKLWYRLYTVRGVSQNQRTSLPQVNGAIKRGNRNIDINWLFIVCGGQVTQNFTPVVPRHGKCELRDSESPLTCWGYFWSMIWLGRKMPRS